MTFIEKDGSERSIRAPLGKDLLTLAHSNDIDLEGHTIFLVKILPHSCEGACEGSLACSTCHVIVEVFRWWFIDAHGACFCAWQDQKFYDRLPEPEDDENDMLDLAFGLTETSGLFWHSLACLFDRFVTGRDWDVRSKQRLNWMVCECVFRALHAISAEKWLDVQPTRAHRIR